MSGRISRERLMLAANYLVEVLDGVTDQELHQMTGISLDVCAEYIQFANDLWHDLEAGPHVADDGLSLGVDDEEE